MFNNIVYLNRDQDTGRKETTELLFKKHSIEATRFSAIEKDLQEYVVEPIADLRISMPQLSCLISHLEIIRQHGSSDLLVFEDDVDIDTMGFWPITFNEFIEALPEHVGIVQLFHQPSVFPVKARKWYPGSFGTVAYYIRPAYVSSLVEAGFKDGRWSIRSMRSTYAQPLADSILYAGGSSMSLNLFGTRDEGSNILPNAGYVKTALEVSTTWKSVPQDRELILSSITGFK